MVKHAEMLKQINTGTAFSMEFVTCDRTRKTGGELRTLVNAVKKISKKAAVSVNNSGLAIARTVNPNHSQHGTINVICADGSMHKVHTRLITKFNNQEVVL